MLGLTAHPTDIKPVIKESQWSELSKQNCTMSFHASHLSVVNESYMHNVPAGSESHFKVIVVSDAFEGLRLVLVTEAVNKSTFRRTSEQYSRFIYSYLYKRWMVEAAR